MISRATFLFIAAFWVTMNVLLWRAEYGSHGGENSVPLDLVWRKILTAPDASALNVYQNGQRTGFCDFSTSVEQEMSQLDENSPPPEGLAAHAGYQIQINGNISVGEFTNRVKFTGRIQFAADRSWREMHLNLSTHFAAVEIRSLAAEQNFHAKVTLPNGTGSMEGVIRFADLQNPNTLLQSVAKNFGVGWLGGLELPALSQMPATGTLAQSIHWEARRDRLKISREPVFGYRLEARVLDQPIVIYTSTLGEILRVELPGGIVATLDTWGKP